MSAEEIERLIAEGDTLIQQERYDEALAARICRTAFRLPRASSEAPSFTNI